MNTEQCSCTMTAVQQEDRVPGTAQIELQWKYCPLHKAAKDMLEALEKAEALDRHFGVCADCALDNGMRSYCGVGDNLARREYQARGTALTAARGGAS